MRIKKTVFTVLGYVSAALGTAGIILPLLPTVPLYLLAAFCFAKSSEKLHDWFVGTELYKKNLESYVRGKGMTLKTKLRIMGLMTVTMLVSAFMMQHVPIVRVILAAVWGYHAIYFTFVVKTIREAEEENKCGEVSYDCIVDDYQSL